MQEGPGKGVKLELSLVNIVHICGNIIYLRLWPVTTTIYMNIGRQTDCDIESVKN